jgi:hypothetical protein
LTNAYVRSRNSDRSIAGAAARRAHATNAASAPPPPPSAPSTEADAQPCDSERTSPSAISPTPAITSAIPIRSSGAPLCGLVDSGSVRTARSSATPPIGRLMKNAASQPRCCTSSEPRLGPTAAARPETAPHSATATGRRAAGNAASTIASDAGRSSAAPIACTTRAATSSSTDPARPHASEPARNTATPPTKMRLRPCRSASRPAGTSSAAYTTVYAFSTHDRSAGVAPANAARSAGNAANSTVASSETRNTAVLAIANVRHGRAAAATAGAPPARASPDGASADDSP